MLLGCLPDLAPPAPIVAIEPASPRPDDALVAVIEAPSADPAGEPVALSVTWTVDGQTVASVGGTTIPADRTVIGQRWAVSVVATIGDASSAPGVAEVVIGAISGDDDSVGDDDVTSAAGSVPGALCAGASTATNGVYTATTCTGPVSSAATATNGTYTNESTTAGTTP